jgi:hypothetical protein
MTKPWAPVTLLRGLIWAAIIGVGFIALGAGLTELPDPVAWQVQADRWLPEGPDTGRLEQTFRPGRAGLAGVDIRVNPASGSEVRTLTVRLLAEADGRELASTQVTVGLPAGPAPVRLRFEPRSESAGQAFRLVVTAADGGPLPPAVLAGSGSDAYPEGQLTLDELPAPGALYFRTYYRPDLSRLGTAVAGALKEAPAVLLAAGAWLLPGLAASVLLGWPQSPDLTARLAAASSLSLAFWPLAYYWAGFFDLPAFETSLGLGVGLAGAALARSRAALTRRPGRLAAEPAPGVVLGLIFGLTLLVRLYPLSDLALTPWVDGPHHALIVRKIFETNRIPDSYAPEVDVPAFYHFGFHVHAAFLARLTGTDPVAATGLTGQLLSAWSAVLAGWLVREWSASAPAGLVGAGLAGLVMTFPGYFLSWSRFSLAAGLDLLPAVFLAGRDLVRSGRAAAALGLLLAGLALTHYRLLAAAGLFVAVLAGLTLRPAGPGVWRRMLLALAAFGTALPWLGTAARCFGVPAVSASLAGAVGPEPFPWDLVVRWPDGLIYLLSLGALLVGLGRGWADALAVLVTLLVVGFLANALPIPTPFPGIIDGVTVASSLWLGALVPAGVGVVRVLETALGRAGLRPGVNLIGPLVLVVCCTQAGRQLATVNPNLILVHPADLPALAWVRANTPADARFLINVFEWRPGLYAGSDAGFWLPAVTGRTTLVPTLLYGNLPPNDLAQRNLIARALVEKPTDWDRLLGGLRGLGVSYVFIGRRGGPIAASDLLSRPEFEPVYHRDGVWVFALRPPSARPTFRASGPPFGHLKPCRRRATDKAAGGISGP